MTDDSDNVPPLEGARNAATLHEAWAAMLDADEFVVIVAKRAEGTDQYGFGVHWSNALSQHALCTVLYNASKQFVESLTEPDDEDIV